MDIEEDLEILKKLACSIADNIIEDNIPKSCIKLGMLMEKIFIMQGDVDTDEEEDETPENEALSKKRLEFMKFLKKLGVLFDGQKD